MDSARGELAIARGCSFGCTLVPATANMGNLVSFTKPRSEVTNYHALSALDIDKQNVDFSSLNGKVRQRGLPARTDLAGLVCLAAAFATLKKAHASGCGVFGEIRCDQPTPMPPTRFRRWPPPLR